MAQILVKDDKFTGKYVAIISMENPVVISSAPAPQEAYEEAVRQGYAEPMILYVPEKDMVQIYLFKA